MKKTMMKLASALLLAASVFSCSGVPAMETASAPATTAVSTETAAAPVQVAHDVVLTAPAAPETVLLRADPLTRKQKAEMATVTSIAAVGGLKATVQKDESACIVFLFDRSLNHGNPYDVTWDYGEAYNAYLDIVDWSLVFDPAYYKSLFPVLALQYHNDDALLLKHFQTVGIHEGRQGCEGFNVAAYKANCSKSLRKAFGDNYECYYLYYLLHQDTESKVKTTGTYPQQLTQKLTIVQATELKWVNKYRAEVDADPLSFDGELAALAAYRAYMDCTEGWDAHDGLQHLLDTDKFFPIMDLMGLKTYCENKFTLGGSKYSMQHSACRQYASYRSSPSHYETMVDPEYRFIGCGNLFVSNQDYNWSGKYDCNRITLDTFGDTVSTPFYQS